MNPRFFVKCGLLASVIIPAVIPLSGPVAYAQTDLGVVRGVTRHPGGLLPLPDVQIRAHSVDEGDDRTVVSGADGGFAIEGLKPGRYELMATKEGFANSSQTSLELAPGQNLSVDVSLGQKDSVSPKSQKHEQGRFFHRLVKAYADDWKSTTSAGPDPARRGFPAPVDGPPYPFPIGPTADPR